jgi:hypothetical protein
MDLCVTRSTDHVGLGEGRVPQGEVVSDGSFEQKNILVNESEAACHIETGDGAARTAVVAFCATTGSDTG